jgi:hypothetical protein
MTLTIELTPEETLQVEEARRRGVDVDAILHRSLACLSPGSPQTGAEILGGLERYGVFGA